MLTNHFENNIKFFSSNFLLRKWRRISGQKMINKKVLTIPLCNSHIVSIQKYFVEKDKRKASVDCMLKW